MGIQLKCNDRRMRSLENREYKILNAYLNHMVYNPLLTTNPVSVWMQDMIQINHHTEVKLLDIGSSFWLGGASVTNVNPSPNLQIELVDQSAIGVKLLKQKVLNRKFDFSVKQMNYDKLDYPNHHFDRVISKIGFQIQSGEEQKKLLEECARVLKPKGIHYILMNQFSLIDEVYRVLNEFDATIPATNPFRQAEIDVYSCLQETYVEFQTTIYEQDFVIRNEKQLSQLLLAYQDQIFIEYIVKRHKGKAFGEFIEQHIVKNGPIILKRKYSLIICGNKKINLHEI